MRQRGSNIGNFALKVEKWLGAKESSQSLAGKGKKMDTPLKTPGGM